MQVIHGSVRLKGADWKLLLFSTFVLRWAEHQRELQHFCFVSCDFEGTRAPQRTTKITKVIKITRRRVVRAQRLMPDNQASHEKSTQMKGKKLFTKSLKEERFMLVSQDFRYSHFSLRTQTLLYLDEASSKLHIHGEHEQCMLLMFVKCGASIETKTDGRWV